MGTFECVVSSLRLGPTDKQAVCKMFSQRSYKTCESRTVVPWPHLHSPSSRWEGRVLWSLVGNGCQWAQGRIGRWRVRFGRWQHAAASVTGRTALLAGAGAPTWFQPAHGWVQGERSQMQDATWGPDSCLWAHRWHTCANPEIWGEGSLERKLISSILILGLQWEMDWKAASVVTHTLHCKFWGKMGA